MTSTASALARWASDLEPTTSDLAVADRSLVDSIAVALAARQERVTQLTAGLSEGAHWAAAGHVLDYDDLHMPSSAHVSVICVPTVLAAGGDARAYLAAAGVMSRLGTALGWPHYSAGWHATCTAGAPASAAGAAVALGLSTEGIATAIALAIPAAGGVQRAFGTDAKSLQVGFAVEAGLRAAALAADGARADAETLDAWLPLVGAKPGGLDLTGPAVPDGLAIKMYPCCYALQRPISAVAELAQAHGLDANDVARVEVRTPESTVVPLIHHRPDTGLQGKFSLEYAVAAALLDRHPGFASFTDAAVRRPAAQRLVGLTEIQLDPGGEGVLDGQLQLKIHSRNGVVHDAVLQHPPGHPARPLSPAQLSAKLADCLTGLDTDWTRWSWQNGADVLREFLPGRERVVA